MNYLNFILLIGLIIFINFFLKKFNLLINNTGESHQIYTHNKDIPLSGGIFLIIFFFSNYNNLSFDLIFYLTSFFLIGIISDIGIIKSPTYRFIFQILSLLTMVIALNIRIYDVRIELINMFLENVYLNIFFVILCFLILINGTNFIDGNNGLVLGYFILIYLLLFYLIDYGQINYEKKIIFQFIVFLFILLILNIFGTFFLGDSGCYILSVFTGITVINIFSLNSKISPFFFATLLWYPCFEILFSLIRKLYKNKSPMRPDTKHLHQLIFSYLNKKFNYNSLLSNSSTGILINIFNLIIIFSASKLIHSTYYQTLLIIFAITMYIITYIKLNDK